MKVLTYKKVGGIVIMRVKYIACVSFAVSLELRGRNDRCSWDARGEMMLRKEFKSWRGSAGVKSNFCASLHLASC